MMDKEYGEALANSYFVDYEDKEFVIALADKKDDNIAIKGIITFDVDNFKEYFGSMCQAIIKFDKETGRNFIRELADDNLKEEGAE